MIVINDIKAWGSTFFTDLDGNIYACGRNDYGQLGIGDTNRYYRPIRINIQFVKSINLGEFHTMFLMYDGTIYATGDNSYGQLGIESTESLITNLNRVLVDPVESVSFAGCYTIFKLKTGDYAICGASPSESKVRTGPVIVDNLSDIILNDQDSVIIPDYDNQQIKVLGYNKYGELGVSHSYPVSNLTTIPKYYDISEFIKVVVGGEHMVILTKDGSVFTVGSNDKHQLGYLTPDTKISTPSIVNLKDIIDVAVGYEHTLFLDNKGNVYGCGSNQNGQLGLGDREFVETPIQLMSNVMKIYCGEFNSFLVSRNGTIYVSGYNEYGNLGYGDRINYNTFIPLSDVIFDTTIKELDPPDDFTYEYTKGYIKHIIEIVYSHIGNGTVKTSCFISTPSMDMRKQFGEDILTTYNTDSVQSMYQLSEQYAKNFINDAKEYIDAHTVYHREAVYKTETIIRLNNGTVLKRDGELTEDEAKTIAANYIKDKYRILGDKIQYQTFSDFDNKIVGEPIWRPTKGARRLVLSELDKETYNYY